MNLIKPKFWDKKISFISLVLIPLSVIFFFVTYFKKKIS